MNAYSYNQESKALRKIFYCIAMVIMHYFMKVYRTNIYKKQWETLYIINKSDSRLTSFF